MRPFTLAAATSLAATSLVAACLAATAALAQTPPAASTPAASAGPPPADGGMRPPPPHAGPRGQGAFIKLEGPGGGEITLRCAEGESTRACADIAIDLLDKARGATRERPDDGQRRWDRDDRYRDRPRED